MLSGIFTFWKNLRGVRKYISGGKSSDRTISCISSVIAMISKEASMHEGEKVKMFKELLKYEKCEIKYKILETKLSKISIVDNCNNR